MTKTNWTRMILLLCIGLLLAYDFFTVPQSYPIIPKWGMIAAVIGLYAVLYFLSRGREDAGWSDFRWRVAEVAWIFGAVLLFSLLGGSSKVGISLSNPVLWIVLLISLYELRKEYHAVITAESAS